MAATCTDTPRRNRKPAGTYADLTFAVKRGDLVEYRSASASQLGRTNHTTLDLATGAILCTCKRAETLPPDAPLDCWHAREVAFAEAVRQCTVILRRLTNVELREAERALMSIFADATTADDQRGTWEERARWCAISDIAAHRAARKAAHAANLDEIHGAA